MKFPGHIAALIALRRAGTPVHVVVRPGELPDRAPRQLVLIGDDPEGGDGLGPHAWDGEKLRRLLRGLNPGAVGVFAGAPLLMAYEALCFSAATLPGGAVIIECRASRFAEWSRFISDCAPFAARFDVRPAGCSLPEDLGAAEPSVRFTAYR